MGQRTVVALFADFDAAERAIDRLPQEAVACSAARAVSPAVAGHAQDRAAPPRRYPHVSATPPGEASNG